MTVIAANPGFYIVSPAPADVGTSLHMMGCTSMPIIGWHVDDGNGWVKPVTIIGVVQLGEHDKITGAGTTWTCEQLADLVEQHRRGP